MATMTATTGAQDAILDGFRADELRRVEERVDWAEEMMARLLVGVPEPAASTCRRGGAGTGEGDHDAGQRARTARASGRGGSRDRVRGRS